MSRLTRWMDRVFYPAHDRNWDDALFREHILRRLSSQAVCLDYGAGRGNVAQMNFKGLCARVAGTDLEPGVLGNPYLDDARVLHLATNHIPYDDASFDVVFADNVMEHVQDPARVFAEIARVLKPGGAFLAKTPNRRHYMPTIARLTPTAFHRFYNRLRGRESIDTFPTVYAVNTRADVQRHAAEAGLQVESIKFVEGRPEYLRINALSYCAGLAYERAVNAIDALETLRCVMYFELRKPA
jgi:SAM-dependent methyltransferase